MSAATDARAPLRRPIAGRSARLLRRSAPVAIGLLAAAIAGVHVARPAIWRDEAASITMAQRDWPAFFATIAHVDAVHALYYGLLHLWFGVVPYSPLTLRLPSVVAAGVTAALLTVLGTRLAGLKAGAAAGALAAVLPSLVWAGGEGRSYAATAMLATASTLALVAALERREGRSAAAWAGYAALLALTEVLFVDAALLAAAHLVTVLLLGRGRRLPGVLAIGAAVAAVVPLALVAERQGGQISWISAYGSPPLWTAGILQQWFQNDAPLAIAWAVAIGGGLLVALTRRRVPLRTMAVALPWAVLPPVALSGIGLVHDPLYWPRYVTFTAPAVALLAGVLLASAPTPVTAVALVALAAIAVPQIRADRLPRAKAQSEMRFAADLVAARRSPADGPSGVLFGQYDGIPGMTTRVEAIAYPAAFAGLTDLTAAVPLRRSSELFGQDLPSTDDAVPRMAGLRTVWILLDLDSTPKTHVPAAAMTAAGLHETGRYRTTGSLLLRWSR